MRRPPFLALASALALLSAFAPAAGCSGGGGGNGGDDDDDDGSTLPGTWTEAAPLPGGPRQETAVVALDGKVYVLGGFAGDLSIVADVEVFDPATGTWDTAEDLPVPMHHANAAAAGGRVWVTGFLTGLDFAADGRVFSYDPVADAWTEGPPMPAGTERGASGVGADGTQIYVTGGLREGIAVADFSVLATAGTSGTWTGLVDFPAGRDHLGAGVIGGIFYAAGGRNGTINGHVPELYAWDPASPAAWTARAPMPTSRGGVAAAVLDGELYVIGGEGNPDDPNRVFPQTEAYDPATDTWSELAPMRTPRHGTGAAAVGTRIWVPGGADDDAFAAVDVNESFER